MATIRQFLLSKMEEKNGNAIGFGSNPKDFYGDYFSMNEVIDKTYIHIFEKMNLNQKLPLDLQKGFCVKFYNSEIGFEVFAQFFTSLENTLNSECFQLIRMYDEIRKMIPDDMLSTINIKNVSDSKQGGLGIVATTPENELNIIYDDKKRVIKKADALSENYGNSHNENNTTGYSTRSRFEMMNYFASFTDVQEKIFNIIDENCFSKIY